MDQLSSERISLSLLPVGARGRIGAIRGGSHLHLRLLGLGLRVGSELEVLHHRGRGVVVAVAGTRVALGGAVAEMLLLDPVPAAPST